MANEALHLARGGGGGSSSGGSSGGGFSGGAAYVGASTASSSNSDGSFWPAFIVFMIVIIIYYLVTRLVKIKVQKNLPGGFVDAKNSSDSDIAAKAKAVEKIFLDFQSAWSEFDLKTIKSVTTDDYYKRMVLELNVLKNYGRKNLMENVEVQRIGISSQTSESNSFDAYIVAVAKDQLIDEKSDKVLFTDSSAFSEIWHFEIKGKKILLAGITQTTEDNSKFDQQIASFAKVNGFYYDSDFGWLMMPSRGAIFGPAGFGSADINNHVIGYYKDKIVEFYSYEPKAGQGMKPLTVAQAILPKKYDDILVTEKSWYNFKPKLKGLEKVETESNDFNKKFSVWAAKPNRATSFELLATNFMERIYKQHYEINIEVVDNVLYFYSPSTNIDYADMLEVLSWAFEEMKM